MGIFFNHFELIFSITGKLLSLLGLEGDFFGEVLKQGSIFWEWKLIEFQHGLMFFHGVKYIKYPIAGILFPGELELYSLFIKL